MRHEHIFMDLLWDGLVICQAFNYESDWFNYLFELIVVKATIETAQTADRKIMIRFTALEKVASKNIHNNIRNNCSFYHITAEYVVRSP